MRVTTSILAAAPVAFTLFNAVAAAPPAYEAAKSSTSTSRSTSHSTSHSTSYSTSKSSSRSSTKTTKSSTRSSSTPTAKTSSKSSTLVTSVSSSSSVPATTSVPTSASTVGSSSTSSVALTSTSSAVSSTTIAVPSPTTVVNSTACGGQTYVYEELAGYGFIASDARDKLGDTIGGIGSSIALDGSSWQQLANGSYTGQLYAIPDRGWNTQGTVNYQNRVHKIQITLTLDESATVDSPSAPNLQMEYVDTILFTDPAGTPVTGLDADVRGPYLTFPSIPFDLPSVHFEGDGFGNDGSGGQRVVMDGEGLFLGHDGSFWVSDEYGPYIYHFSATGSMIGAIRPPDAIIPLRNSSESFSADSPPIYDPSLAPIPTDNPTGRDNNQGFEGLTTNPDGTRLYVLLQSATNQDGGPSNKNSRNSRFLIYDITTPQPTYLSEYVVSLARTVSSDSSSKIARQSEIHYVSDTQFMVLARDSGEGRGQGADATTSVYRHVDIFDISAATDIKGDTADCSTCSIATSKGVLNSTITAAQYCPWLDFNVNSQLNRFGVHNGGADDAGLLNEKWESMALLPVNPGSNDEEFFLLSLSDNDFITQNGYLNSGAFQYSDASGYDLLNQALVFRVRLPSGSTPLVS
ncbi:hypothetical protein LTR27_002421 [Elasticomyces elasticus]|nr:hypothetical protein LTR27_002421 [Elasticomyces elasticus]